MGKIDKILLRGISRTPSDRMTKDGGCAESLNVYLDNEELAPVASAKEVTSFGNGTDKIFIHNTNGNQFYIIINRGNPIQVYYQSFTDTTRSYLLSMESGELFHSITSIGNTLIISGSSNIYYAICQGDTYQKIGTSIPHPDIEIKPRTYRGHPGMSNYLESTLYHGDVQPSDTSLESGEVAVWQETIEKESSELKTFRNLFWEGMNSGLAGVAGKGLFCYPVFIRYALKLYDGSYIYQSAPILMGAGFRRFMECTLNTSQHTGPTADAANKTYYTTSIKAAINQYYKIDIKLYETDYSRWRDVVKSIDIFISEPVLYPNYNSEFAWVDDNKVVSFQNNIDSDEEYESIRDTLLSKTQFYLIQSYPIDNLKPLNDGVILTNKKEYFQTESLYTLERLPDDFRSNHKYTAKKISSFNNRILASGITEELYPGAPQPFSLKRSVKLGSFSPTELDVFYKVIDSYGNILYVRGVGTQQSSSIQCPPIIDSYVPIGGSHRVPSGFDPSDTSYFSVPSGFVTYPDTRCVAMYFRFKGSTDAWKEIEMQPHPSLQCSYGYKGIDKMITELEGLPTVNSISENQRGNSYSEYLFQSKADNPFYFPAAGRYQIGSTIIGYAIATHALSEGQFGQFPLYVFTNNGIWAMDTRDDGSFANLNLLSRDVCSNATSITALDQSVAYVTKKGAMILTGSSVKDISPSIIGKPYAMEETPKTIIAAQSGFKDESGRFSYLDAVNDSTPFLSFIQQATIGYDYSGNRLIFFHEDLKYQYVYTIDTETWHKLYQLKASSYTPINSFPELYVSITNTNGTVSLLDFSIRHTNYDDWQIEKAIIATRPFDLGEPDVHKTIKDVRIRGQYRKGAVKFILLGSDDGINFCTISTLRGKAWKLFRIIILADLQPSERISWIEVEYDTRFTNRLR